MPGYGARYWAERTAPNRRRTYSRFTGQHTADVVVIGGGVTGCTAAYGLAQAGLDVVLLEADRLASGSTAASLGAILPEPDARYRLVEDAVGRHVARTAWKEARRSALEFASVLTKLQTRCDLAPATLLINAPTSLDASTLKGEQAARRDANVSAPFLSRPAALQELGTESYGALRSSGAAVFDPVRAALGLATAAAARGARIFERSRVTRTRFTRKEAFVSLSSGTIRTKGVVVATGEPGALFGQLCRHVRRSSGYVVVTHRLTAPMLRETGRHAGVITEISADPHWLRWLPDGRALFAGALSRPVGARQVDQALVQRTAQLMYELSVRYPVISGLPAAWSWEVPVVSTLDGLPWIGPHRNYPFHFFAMALGWHGDGLAWAAARAAGRYFKGEHRPDDEALSFVRHL